MGEENKGTPGRASPDYPRREELDYYEVDLRDYIRILWRGKWIILFCTFLAIGVAAFVSFRSPDVYQVDARLSVVGISLPGIRMWAFGTEGIPLSGYFEFKPVSAAMVAEWAKDREVAARAVELSGEDATPGWITRCLEVKVLGTPEEALGDKLSLPNETLVELSLKGSLPPETLTRLLEGLIRALKERAREAVRNAISSVAADLNARRKVLEARKRAWEEKLLAMKARAESQRASTLAQIDSIVAEDTPVKETAGGYRLRKELDRLYQRLSAVELLLDEIDRLGIGALPGAAEDYVLLEGELAELAVQNDILEALAEDPPAPIVVLRGPQVPTAPVGPNRKMNIAVAGVLGLFVGVLLAFLWSYVKNEEDVSG